MHADMHEITMYTVILCSAAVTANIANNLQATNREFATYNTTISPSSQKPLKRKGKLFRTDTKSSFMYYVFKNKVQTKI